MSNRYRDALLYTFWCSALNGNLDFPLEDPNLPTIKCIKIRDKIIDSLGYAELITLLAPIGCTMHMIKKISQDTKDISLLKQQIIENPYMLCDIPHMGFKKVDGNNISDFKAE